MLKKGIPNLLVDYSLIRELSMRSLFESLEELCEGTVVVDTHAHIVWINERYAARFGPISATDAIGRPVEEVIPNSLMRKVVATGQPILLDLMDAVNVTFVVTRIPLWDTNGKLIGAAGFALYDQVQSLKPLFARLESMQRELAQAHKRLAHDRRPKYTFSNFIGSSPGSMEVKRQARRAAQLDATVLLLGETGTGKEVLAHAIHAASTRWENAFVSVNVSAIPETLLEAEFFGVAPGAYTGAEKRGRDGKFKLADGGTLFLDEIGDMPLVLQSKLLRVLQEQEFEPVGSNHVTKVDVRVIAATSVHLQKRVDEGLFRADLYYRLNVLSIHVPPLRERLSDIEALCENILELISLRTGFPNRELTADAICRLKQCAWRGNIRELRNVLEKVLMLTDKTRLSAEDLEGVLPIDSPLPPMTSTADEGAVRPYAEAFEEFERRLLTQALVSAQHKVDDAARMLGMARATCYRKMKVYGLLSQ